MITATITYKDGTEEKREFVTFTAYAKFIDDHAGTIREANAEDIRPRQYKQGRMKANGQATA